MSERIVHRLSFEQRAQHRLSVRSTFPTGSGAQLELAMAVWTPGSYLVREYARHLEGFAARDTESGAPLAFRKVAKNRWRIECSGVERVEVAYRLYARQLTVQSNFVDRDLACLNGASTFLFRPERIDLPHEVHLELPEGWTAAYGALPQRPGATSAFLAADFDTLVDSPLVAGRPEVRSFSVEGKPHLLIEVGGDGVWDGERAAREAEAIVAAEARFWGGLPYERYLFFNLLVESGGGLEHRDSTLLMASRWQAGTRKGWLDWLSLVAHEFFHVWNVKRLRPVELGPFDYEREVLTESLWIAEGITSYYDDLFVHRAGLSTREEYLERLSETIERVQTTPGRHLQPLALASLDTWIKLYRPDENSRNSSLSYYPKGALVAFLLDVEIRRASEGSRSLDDLMREAYRRHSGERGFRGWEFEALASEIAGVDLGPFLERALRSTEELDYAPALALYGLCFGEPEPGDGKETGAKKLAAGWLGAKTKVDDGRLLVTEVPRDTPAEVAGLNVDDEILGLGGYRVKPRDLAERLESFRPGAATELTVARRERLLALSIALGEEPKKPWRLRADPAATPEQQARLAAWLTGQA